MVTKEVLEALRDSQAVEWKCTDGDWKTVALVSGKIKERGLDGKWAVVAQDVLDAIMMFTRYEWRLPAEKRDWAGALEWLKEGKAVARLKDEPSRVFVEPSTAPGRLNVYHDGYWTLNIEDYEAKDWVVAR